MNRIKELYNEAWKTPQGVFGALIAIAIAILAYQRFRYGPLSEGYTMTLMVVMPVWTYLFLYRFRLAYTDELKARIAKVMSDSNAPTELCSQVNWAITKAGEE